MRLGPDERDLDPAGQLLDGGEALHPQDGYAVDAVLITA
jgi:hypothetical protein